MDDTTYSPTDLRLQLLKHGFDPLALEGKRPTYPEWSTIEITEERILSREWSRSTRLTNTGIRCGSVVALDFDIGNADLLQEFGEYLETAIPSFEWSTYVRVGRAPRELLVYRTLEPFGKRRSGVYVDGDETLQVEVLGKGSQFAAFGIHPVTGMSFTWPETPLDDFTSLPVITQDMCERIVAAFDAWATSRSFERVVAAGSGEAYEHRALLTGDMVFEVVGVGAVRVDEMVDRLDGGRRYRCSMSPIREESVAADYGSILVHGGVVTITDHGADQATYTRDTSADMRVTVEAFALAIAGRAGSQGSGAQAQAALVLPNLVPGDNFDIALTKALARYALFEETGDVIDMLTGALIKAKGFQGMIACFSREETLAETVARGGNTPRMVSLYSKWTTSARQVKARSVETAFEEEWPTYADDFGLTRVNRWRPPEWPEGVGTIAPFTEFMVHLLPDAVEREWYLSWLAHKVQIPAFRGVAVLMVADKVFGTGRGSLQKILGRLWGGRFVTTVSSAELMGEGSQSQYNDWLSDNLMVLVGEVLEESGAGSYFGRRRSAYEHIKELVDTGTANETRIRRKGVTNSTARVYANVQMSTNHADAMVLPSGDRRICVLSNGEALSEAMADGLTSWMSRDDNIAALWHWLMARPLSGFDATTVLGTEAREIMISEGVSDATEMCARVMQELASRDVLYIASVTYIELLHHALTACSPAQAHGRFPRGWEAAARGAFRDMTTPLGSSGAGRSQRVDGKVLSVRMNTFADRDANGVCDSATAKEVAALI